MATTEWGRVSYEDLANGIITTVIIKAEETSDGVTFMLEVQGNSAVSPGDLLGFFLDFEPDITKPGQDPYYNGEVKAFTWENDEVTSVGTAANNMNGAPSYVQGISNDPDPDFDIGLQLSDTGASSGNLTSTTFTIYGIKLDDLDGQNFGVRLQNTLNTEGSLKLVGQFEKPDDPACEFGGYSRGSWLNGARSDGFGEALEYVGISPAITFEQLIFGTNQSLTFTSREGGIAITHENPDLIQTLGLNGGGNNQLAAQATAAYLNALYLEKDGDPLTCYQLSTSAIKTLTADALEGQDPVDLSGYYWYIDTNGIKGFQASDMAIIGNASMTANDLKNLFDFNNNLSELTTPLPNPMLSNPMVGV